MNYYALIRNALGEWSLFAQGSSKEAAEKQLQPLLDAGFEKKAVKVVRGLSATGTFASVSIIFTTFNGRQVTYPLKSTNPLRDFQIAIEWALTRQLSDICSVSMTDNRNKELYQLKFSDIFKPS